MTGLSGENSLSTRRVLITGGASGIGEACCRMFVESGAFVVIADRNEQAGKDLERELNGLDVEQVDIPITVLSKNDI